MTSLRLYSKTRRRRAIGVEACLQITVVEHLRLACSPRTIFFRVPNDGKRSAAAGAHEKRMGLTCGVADLCILVPGQPASFLELKSPGERQSLEQVGFELACRDNGARYAVSDNIDHALAILWQWGALRYEPAARRSGAERRRVAA